MSLVYLITGLPRIDRGAPPPLSRTEFVRRCREELRGPEREEFELLVQIESVEETVRLALRAQLDAADDESVAGAVVLDRQDGVPVDRLPEWVLRPAPQHELLRRHYYEVTQAASTEFLRRWANFRVDIGEVITAKLCRVDGMSRDAFLVQMQGSFDASAPLIMRSWEDPTLGLGQRFWWLDRVLRALEDEDLLAMSRELDAVLWEKVEELSTHETFSVETLLETYLKLRILEREASWDAERGRAMLDRILAMSAEATAGSTAGKGTA